MPIGAMTQGYLSTLMVPDLVNRREILNSVLDVTRESESFVGIMELLGRSTPTDNSTYSDIINTELYTNITIVGAPTENTASVDWDITVSAGDYANVREGELLLCANKKVALIKEKKSSNVLNVYSVDETDLDLADTQKLAVFSNASGAGSSAPSARRYGKTSESNHIHIFKEAYEFDDIAVGSKVEFEYEGKPYYLFLGAMEAYRKFEADIAMGLIFSRQSAASFDGSGQTLVDKDGKVVSTTKGLNQYTEEGISLGTTGVTISTYATIAREFSKQRAPKEYMVLLGTEARILHDNMIATLGANQFSDAARLIVNGKDIDLGAQKMTLYGRTFYLKDLPLLDHKNVVNFTGSAGFQNRSWFLPMDEITTVDGKRLPRFSTRYLESAPSPFSVDLRYREIHEGGLAATPTSSESILRVVYESRQGLHLLGKQHFALLDNA